jgi:hypothetical protein
VSISRRGFFGTLLGGLVASIVPLPKRPPTLLEKLAPLYLGEFKWINEAPPLVPAEVGHYFTRYECFTKPLSAANEPMAIAYRRQVERCALSLDEMSKRVWDEWSRSV